MNQLWCNGRWLALMDFPNLSQDRGLLHGLGLFETMLSLDGKLVLADRHLARLRAACKRLGWTVDSPDIHSIADRLLVDQGLTGGRARIRLAITAGSGTLGDLRLGDDRIIWMTAHSCEVPPGSLAVGISPWLRNEHSPLAGLKCASYAENLIALDHARRHGFDEILFFNTSGGLCEAATANVFLVKNGNLFTPPLESGCLPGITREVVIELAAMLGISCRLCALTSVELQAADECFLTSSTRGVIAVSRLDQRAMAHGPVTERLARSWREFVVKS
jgi:branched-chain amino acid aminotransferase